MNITQNEKSAIESEIAAFKSAMPALTRLNMDLAGAIVDLNKLAAAGWRDQIKPGKGVEYFIAGTLYTELVESIDGVEYRVTVASNGSKKLAENANGFLCLSPEELDMAVAGKMARLVHFRRAIVYKIGEGVCEAVGELPAALAGRVERDLKAAVRVPAKTFLADLEYQTELEKTRPPAGANEFEAKLFKLAAVLQDSCEKRNPSSTARLLTPLAKAVLISGDAAASRALASLERPQAILAIARYTAYSRFDAAAVAIFQMLAGMENARYTVMDTQAFASLAASLLRAGLLSCANCAIREMMRLYDLLPTDDQSQSYAVAKAVYNVLHAACDRLKTLPADPERCQALQMALKSMDSLWKANVNWRMLYAVANYRMLELSGENLDPARKMLEDCLKDASDAYDAGLAGEDDDDDNFKKSLPVAVKNPFVWHALIYTSFGLADVVVKAFPESVPASAAQRGVLPVFELIKGTRPGNIWAWLVAGGNGYADHDSIADLSEIAERSRELDDRHEVRDMFICEIGSFRAGPGKNRLVFDKNAARNEISIVAMEHVDEAGGSRGAGWFFPFLPTKHPEFRENIVGAIWKYFPWIDVPVAEAMIRLDDGERRTIYAIMPYYTEDKECCPRGMRFNGRLCAFADSIKKNTPKPLEPIIINEGPLADENGGPVELGIDPDFFDSFEQDVYREEITRSGFFLHGRYVSKRIFKAFGREIACVRIRCKRLAFELDAYTAVEHLPPDLAEGDQIDVEGWMYVDFTTQVDSNEEYKNRYIGKPPIAPLEDEFIHGAPIEVRGDVKHDWQAYARDWLVALDGVTDVVRCDFNELRVDFLIRRYGKTRALAFFITTADEPIQARFNNVDMLVLVKTPRGRRVKLDWLMHEVRG